MGRGERESVAVVIPARYPGVKIRACLDSIRAQTLAPAEVIVVDSSDDETPERVRREYPEVTLLHRSRPTPAGEARNLGADAAGTELVAFIDSDCAAGPRWLESLLTARRDHRAPGVVGSVGGPAGESWVAELDRSFQFSGYEPTRPGRWIGIGPGCNLLLCRRRLAEVGGFPSTPRAQDTLLCRRYVARYGRLRFEPSAPVAHLSPDRLEAVFQRQFSQGGGLVQSRREDPSLPGSIVLRHPMLFPTLPLARAGRIVSRLASADRRLLAVWLRHPMAVGRCLRHWTRGVRAELAKPTSARPRGH